MMACFESVPVPTATVATKLARSPVDNDRQQTQRTAQGASEAAVARMRRSCKHGERYDAMAHVADSADGRGTRKIRAAFRAGKQ